MERWALDLLKISDARRPTMSVRARGAWDTVAANGE